MQPICDSFKSDYVDEYTGERLPDDLIRKAMVDEMEYVGRLVWDIATAEEARQDPEAVVVGGRWVNCNEGDVSSPKVRARYVATEVNHGDDAQYFAATPPLEAVRLLVSKFAQRVQGNRKLKLGFLDITKAYFHAKPQRDVYVRVPKELGLPAGTLGRLKRCCYGTRDAGARWENARLMLSCSLVSREDVHALKSLDMNSDEWISSFMAMISWCWLGGGPKYRDNRDLFLCLSPRSGHCEQPRKDAIENQPNKNASNSKTQHKIKLPGKSKSACDTLTCNVHAIG